MLHTHLLFKFIFIYQIENGIPIINFYDNKEDRELYDLKEYLMKMLDSKDVREFNKKMFKLK